MSDLTSLGWDETFAEQFAAVLDAKTGGYVITLTGPQLGAMSFSTTPMRDPQTGAQKPIDFGVAAIVGNGIAYFLMEHDPAWVRRYVEAGATRLLVRSPVQHPGELGAMADQLARYRDEVVGAL